AVGGERAFLRERRQVILGVEDLQVREQFGPLTDQVGAPAPQVARFAHALGVSVGEREGAAPQQAGDLTGVKAVVLGLAAVDGFQVQGVAEDEGDVLLDAAIGDPVPGEQALGADHEVVAIRLEGPPKRLWPTGDALVEDGLAGLVEEAPVPGPGVQVDATVAWVLSLVESPHGLPGRGSMRWRRNRSIPDEQRP